MTTKSTKSCCAAASPGAVGGCCAADGDENPAMTSASSASVGSDVEDNNKKSVVASTATAKVAAKSCCSTGSTTKSCCGGEEVANDSGGGCCASKASENKSCSSKVAEPAVKKSCCSGAGGGAGDSKSKLDKQRSCCGKESEEKCASKVISPAPKSCCSGAGDSCSKPAKQSSCCAKESEPAEKDLVASGKEKESEGKCSSKVVVVTPATATKLCSKPATQSSCCGTGNEDKCSSNVFVTPEIKQEKSESCSKPAKQSSCCDPCDESCTTRSTIKCTSPATDSCCADDSKDNGKSCAAKDTSNCCVVTHTCLAVLRPDKSAIDVFDTKGRSKTFRITNKRIANMLANNKKKLCFSTHGADGDIDGMLTPCFDGNGEHDEPEEGCACGVDEPHLHAHIYDPEVCDVADQTGCARMGASVAAARKKATNWRFQSQVTLELVEDEEGEDGAYCMPITESMPKECNSSALKNHLNDRGLKMSNWLRWRNDGRKNRACSNENDYCGDNCESHRLYPVHHEDHTDFLIHNETSGELHMEHPCASCGENDIHGRFRLVHTRSWAVEDHKSKGKGTTRINLHFFELHDKPFQLLDVLSGMFDLESSRVHAVRPVSAGAAVEETSGTSSSRVGRSQFFVKNICCSSEIPQVESILRPMEGIVELSINPTTRTVYVDHNVDVVSANGIANELSSQGFGALVKKDAVVAMDQMAGIPTDVFVGSVFDLTDAFNGTNESDMGKIVDVIKACLDQKFSETQLKNVAVDGQDKTLSVDHNPYFLTASGIIDVLASHLYDVKIIDDGGADGMWALSLMKEDTQDTIEHESSNVRWAVILSGVLWVVSMLSLIGGNWDYLKYIALLSVAFGLPPIAVKAFRTLRRCHFDVNCMMFFAAVGALALQEYTESAAVTFLFAISEALETRATARARNALSAIVCLRPERANVINQATKDIVVLPASAVAVGTLVSVRTGDKIPCDGVVVEGKSTVDESSLTGESRPVNKSPGKRVSGGTINTGNTQLVIKTTATSNNSAVARLIRLIEEAQSNRSETEKMVDSFAKVYTPIVVLAALCMCTIPWAFGTETGQFWAKNGLITIVIACPCALIISTPVTYVAGLAAVAQKGVIVKGGQYLEGLGRVKTIAFDKTGTISQGVFALLHFNVVGQTRSRKEVLEYLALMEAPASHPLSDAIVKGAANEQVDIPKNLKLQNHTLLPGEGITAIVSGKKVHVGNKKLFQRLNLYDDLPGDVKNMEDEWAGSGGTTGFISIDGEGVVGAYCVADKIRDEARAVVEELRKMGIEIVMLTGDQRPAAIGIGRQIGLRDHDIKSELLPEDKLADIGDMVRQNEINQKFWKTKRAVMMVGDGVNDAPALALADVSVAMGEGAALAMDTADVTLMDSNLNKILYTVRMGRRVIRTIIENVAFSLIVKAVVMGFTFAGKSSLWAAIATDVGAMLIVTINGMKLLPSSRKVKENDLAHGYA